MNSEMSCSSPQPPQPSENIGTKILYEDADVKIWTMELAPNASTEMHKHLNDYYFIALTPGKLCKMCTELLSVRYRIYLG